MQRRALLARRLPWNCSVAVWLLGQTMAGGSRKLSFTVGVLKETCAGERRVAMVPRTAEILKKLGLAICMESGAGAEAGFPDAEYSTRGVEIASSAADVCRQA